MTVGLGVWKKMYYGDCFAYIEMSHIKDVSNRKQTWVFFSFEENTKRGFSDLCFPNLFHNENGKVKNTIPTMTFTEPSDKRNFRFI